MSAVARKKLLKGWTIVLLQSVICLQKGKKPQDLGEKSVERIIPYIDIKAFESGEIRKYCTDEKVVLCKEDDVLVVWDGARSGLVGFGAKGAVGSTIAKVDISGLYSKYLYYFLKMNYIYLNTKTRGVGIPHVDPGVFNNLEFPLAPPEQQKRIVAKIEELFSHIDAGIEALKKAKQLLKQYRQSVLKAAVTGELTKEWREANKKKSEPTSKLLKRILKERENDYSRKLDHWEKELTGWKAGGEREKKPAKPQKLKVLDDISYSKISNLWSLPVNWRWIKLGNLAVDVFDGPFGSNLKSNDYVEEGVRVIRLENIGNLEFKGEKVTYITEKKYEALKKHAVSAGDIIFSSFVADGTQVVVLPVNIEKAINKADCFCVRAFGDSINAVYLANLLSTTSTYKRLENQVHGATRPRINTTQLKELEVPLCTELEQVEVVRLTGEKLEAIARLENGIDHQLIKAEKNKQSILASAFSGAI